MYHTIQFIGDFTIDREISSKHPLERILVRKGTRMQVQMKPYVVETIDGPVEVADLYFADSSVTRMVRFACFSFVE